MSIQPFAGDLKELINLIKLSSKMETNEAAEKLANIEIAKGTHYWTIKHEDGKHIAMVGLYLDVITEVRTMEPPQIIDVAVLPEHRGKGHARDLLLTAEAEVWKAGETQLWLFTDGQSESLHRFYIACGYRRAGELPGYWGPGSMKAFYVKGIPN